MWCVGDLPSFPGFWRLLIDLALMLPRQLTNKNSEQRMKKTVPLISKTQIPSTEIETKWGNYTKIPVIIFLTKLLGSTLVLYHVICCTKWFQVCARNPKIDWNVTNHFINFRVRLSCSFVSTVYRCCWRKNWCFFFFSVDNLLCTWYHNLIISTRLSKGGRVKVSFRSTSLPLPLEGLIVRLVVPLIWFAHLNTVYTSEQTIRNTPGIRRCHVP